LIEIVKDVLSLAHIRKGMTGKINAYQAVIGKAVLITQAEVTRKKYQKKFGQTLIYNFFRRFNNNQWLVYAVLISYTSLWNT
jgi:hypothetical protein